MLLSQQFSLRPGVTTLIGSGGKTSFLRTAGEELAAMGNRVILTTTTKIYPFPNIPLVTGPEEELAAAFEKSPLLCCGTPLPEVGKLTTPPIPLSRLAAWADYVLVEGDGSAGLPLKAHSPHEPVIPPESADVIQVVGWSGMGRPIRECAHRPQLYAQLAGVSEDSLVTPEIAAAVLNGEHLANTYFINQADDPDTMEAARELAKLLPHPCHIGSLNRRNFICLS